MVLDCFRSTDRMSKNLKVSSVLDFQEEELETFFAPEDVAQEEERLRSEREAKAENQEVFEFTHLQYHFIPEFSLGKTWSEDSLYL